MASAVFASTPAFDGDREAQRRAQDAANNALLLQRMQGIADRHVPAAFRDSFLNRNATNRELFALARRLG